MGGQNPVWRPRNLPSGARCRWAIHTAEMGSKGIRRRKPAHHLPKVSDRDIPNDNDLIPPIMWPSTGSGFEADPLSPTGSAQRQWWLIRAAQRGSNRRTRTLGWLFVTLIAIPVGVGLVIQPVQLIH
jgi:hypothetical protein